MRELKRMGAVIGLSGGLDSAVAAVLAVRSLGKDKVHLLYMPERDSNPIHGKHAEKLANYLGLRLYKKNITSVLRATRTYRILPLWPIPGRTPQARDARQCRVDAA